MDVQYVGAVACVVVAMVAVARSAWRSLTGAKCGGCGGGCGAPAKADDGPKVVWVPELVVRRR